MGDKAGDIGWDHFEYHEFGPESVSFSKPKIFIMDF
jgi:hypothetical protein